jgi:protein-tyrosine-phosphatase
MVATPFAIEAAKVWGVDISRHKARHLERAMLTEADLILAMSAEHVDMMHNKIREAANKMFLIKAFPAPFSHSQEGVNDPIGGAIDDYNQTYLELDEILRRIEGRIIQFGDSLKRNS